MGDGAGMIFNGMTFGWWLSEQQKQYYKQLYGSGIYYTSNGAGIALDVVALLAAIELGTGGGISQAIRWTPKTPTLGDNFRRLMQIQERVQEVLAEVKAAGPGADTQALEAELNALLEEWARFGGPPGLPCGPELLQGMP
jgi:hypothetical protein